MSRRHAKWIALAIGLILVLGAGVLAATAVSGAFESSATASGTDTTTTVATDPNTTVPTTTTVPPTTTEPARCTAELYLAKVDVVMDTDINALDTWRFRVTGTKRQVTGTFGDQFQRDSGTEGYDVSIFDPPIQVVGLKGDAIPTKIEVEVSERDGRVLRGRAPDDIGSKTTELTLRCPAAGAVAANIVVDVPVPANPAGGLAGIEKNGSLRFSFVCRLDP